MDDRDRLIFEGEVIDANKGKVYEFSGMFRRNDNLTVLCTLSGKIRMNSVKILLGDTVRVEVSEYDPNMGRIVYRIKGT